MSRTSKRTFSLSAKKRALLEALLQEEGIASSLPKGIPRRKDAGSYPLSFAQQRLWFLDQLEPNSPFYNTPAAIRLVGGLRLAALEKSLNEIVRRHEALRTNFTSIDGWPEQVIAPTLNVTLQLLDLRDLPESERDREIRRLIGEEARRPFDLQQEPPFRACLLRTAEDEHVLFINMHHIVSDGWSFGVLFRELTALYGAFSKGNPSPLPELPIQYADYAAWQREWLRGEILEKQLCYWRRQLGGELPVLELPGDRPRPAVQTFRGGERQFVILPHSLSEALEALSRREGGTLFMTLLAAFKTLLSRYTNEEDIIVGSPIANRNRAEIEGLIGFFVNTLVLRTQLSGNPTFRELLSRVRETTLGAYEHQDVPFEKLVEELQPERNLSHAPLFQVMFALQNAAGKALELEGLTLHSLRIDHGTSKFDLTLFIWTEGEGLRATVEYNADLFDASTIKRMLGHFQTLLEAVVANPDQLLSSLPLLTTAERHQLLIEWNSTQEEYPSDKTVQEMFEQQVERTPESVAVIFQDEQLTYAELNNRANQLAHFLREQGVGPEVRVGISMERSLEMVVGLLGILKAGSAYVPLDPAYPMERLAFMVGDAEMPVLLTQERLVESLPASQPRLVRLDTDWKTIARQSKDNPESSVRSENPAYVIYTSGSTGKPKGVTMTHRSLANLLSWQRQTSLLGNGARTLQFASLSFDVSFQEIFSTWWTGGTLILIPEELRGDALSLLRFLTDQAVERLFLPFVALQQLSEVSDEDAVPGSLREVITAGEQLQVTRQMVNLFKRLPGCRLVNQYGPSESHVVTSFTLTGSPNSWAALPPIGRPIANTQIYIVDRNLNPVPIGVLGELYIGGEGLARGYLNRPELTAERFIDNPFNAEASDRLFKTGDVARYLPDGNIEFLGRIDHQVKVRGYRIELGEIETALASHSAVREAVVIAWEDKPGDKRLVAYVLFEQEAPSVSEMRSYLKQKLPDYMVPATFVVLDALPLTPSGKVDRRALPAPDQARPELEGTYVAPRNSVEEVVAGIWAEVLKLERVGIHDNFFELGGHSLLATRVISRVRAALRVELSLRTLFEEPSVAGLAKRIGEARQVNECAHMVPLLPVARNGAIPLSFAQQRLWFLDQLEPGSAFYNMPAALRLSGRLNIEALEQALTTIVARHESLRTTFTTVDESPVQVIASAPSVALPVTDLSSLPASDGEAEAQRLATEEMQRPFNLAQGPLVRVSLLRLGGEEHVLLLNMHHIVSDGWSVDVLFQELTTLYAAFSSGQPSPLQELPIQYADYAVWQREWLQGEVLKEQLDYWMAKLAAAPAVLELPADRPRPAMQTFRGARQFMTLPKSVSEALRNLSRQEGVTFFTTLLAAFQTLLMRYSGQHDIVVGSPIAGRTRAETEELIGFFANTLALRTDLSGNPTFRQLLERVQEVTLGAYEHQDVPFEKLVEELQPERSLSHAPLFQVMFSLQDARSKALELPGLSLGPVFIDTGTSKFDLTLLMSEGAEGLFGRLEYSTDLFEEAMISRMLGHFEVLLAGIVADPGQRLSELPLMSEAERRQVLVEWNETGTEYPRDKTVGELFEAQAEQTPEAVAVVFAGEELSYGELNRRANQVARHLRGMGVGPEVLVGIMMERSLEMVIGLLGILKAGGAYVPLDSGYPPERLSFMLKDAGVAVMVTQSKLVGSLAEHGAEVTCLDADWEAIAGESEENVKSEASAESLAYVMYTSGSTGRPKGVAVSHRSIVRLVKQTNYVKLSADEVFLQFAPVSFDASTFELWGCLLNGARLVVFPAHTPSLEELGRVVREQQVTILWLTAGLFHQMVDDHMEGLGGVRQLLAGGDVLSVPHVEKVLRELPGCQLINGYGPTENTTFTCCHRLGGEAQLNGSVPIGRPISNTRVYVLDRWMQPVPIGVGGELYIGGDGLARGYLNRAELTSERFVGDPFSEEPGARLYRTGDLVRYREDGSVEFLGRFDQQVKVRGYRIELGEIEAVLSECAGVREATVVVVREGVASDKRLVAYVVPSEGHGADASGLIGELRRNLKARVPEYMVPSGFVLLDELPLTPSGKVDRRALPAPDEGRPELEQRYVAPRTATEEVVAGIWSEVLKVEQVGIHDNFFELGGHSLSATQVISRVRKSLQVELPLRTLFEEPTVAGLIKEVVRIWGDPDIVEDIARVFKQLEHLSEAEVKLMLSEQMQQVDIGN